MALPRIGYMLICIDIDDLDYDDADEYVELTEGGTYEVLDVDGPTVYIENDFGNRVWYDFSRFELEANTKRKFVRNLPNWF